MISIFTTPTSEVIFHADLVCAIMLLVVMSLKVVTLKQDVPLLKRFNTALSIILYPVGLTFGLILFQWIFIG